MILPPPPRWDRANDGIESAFKWGEDFERSLLPADVVFPRPGQIWAAVRDCEVTFFAYGSGPVYFFAGGSARLQRGERVRIIGDELEPLQITFQPVRYHELESSIVEPRIRTMTGYLYYSLSLRLARTLCCLYEEVGYFHELFRLDEDLPQPAG